MLLNKLAIFSLFMCWGLLSIAQIPSPDSFLGYPLGSRFTPHQRIVDYFRALSVQAPNVKLESYGKSYEGRDLIMAIVSDSANMSHLETIRERNLTLAKGDKNATVPAGQPAILWLSYNVHGNEASSSEAAMRVLYTLTQATDTRIKQWLKNTIVILDPCLNPDGRERYVQYFKAVSGELPDPDPAAREHTEPWPGGRSNHYYFDLNRDWVWQTQKETQARLTAYHHWLPQVHIDFHEQSYNEPYYFAPAAEPIHQNITPWQREFQLITGKNNAKYFDEMGWRYFTKERFDLLYPAYGDTYPLYNGAIGMTYEQGGIRAGLAVITSDGDTLRLKDRINHHFTTSIASLETVSAYSTKLVNQFKTYFEQSVSNPPGNYRSVVVKAENLSRLNQLADLLRRNHISYTFGGQKNLSGYRFDSKKIEHFALERNDLVINLHQPHSVLASILFEPETAVSDSNTYDITAWALPYIYGLPAYGLTESLNGAYPTPEQKARTYSEIDKPYAWVVPWGSMTDVAVIMALQKNQLKIRIADESFTAEGKTYAPGTLLLYRADNQKVAVALGGILSSLEKTMKTTFIPLKSGLVDKGKDLGSSAYRLIQTPKIAIVSSPETSSQSVGELWHFFEQELHFPVTFMNTVAVGNLIRSNINILILPDGLYHGALAEPLNTWVGAGGKLILFEEAIPSFLGKPAFDIKQKEYAKKEPPIFTDRKYEEKDHDDFSTSISGAIYKVALDTSHPINFGLGSFYYAIKTDDKLYEPLQKGWNTGMIDDNSYMSGLVGKTARKKLAQGMLFGVQPSGKGHIIYFGSDPLFRAFWESGKQLFLNALFLVN